MVMVADSLINLATCWFLNTPEVFGPPHELNMNTERCPAFCCACRFFMLKIPCFLNEMSVFSALYSVLLPHLISKKVKTLKLWTELVFHADKLARTLRMCMRVYSTIEESPAYVRTSGSGCTPTGCHNSCQIVVFASWGGHANHIDRRGKFEVWWNLKKESRVYLPDKS